jgi:hypothetical protein
VGIIVTDALMNNDRQAGKLTRPRGPAAPDRGRHASYAITSWLAGKAESPRVCAVDGGRADGLCSVSQLYINAR